jgi:hypothetical protein
MRCAPHPRCTCARKRNDPHAEVRRRRQWRRAAEVVAALLGEGSRCLVWNRRRRCGGGVHQTRRRRGATSPPIQEPSSSSIQDLFANWADDLRLWFLQSRCLRDRASNWVKVRPFKREVFGIGQAVLLYRRHQRVCCAPEAERPRISLPGSGAGEGSRGIGDVRRPQITLPFRTTSGPAQRKCWTSGQSLRK